eukprot:scaffold17381_cov54-Cylindrotheca_fusiformis.AAC.1
MSPSSTSRLQVLAQLQQYSNLSNRAGQDTFKSCLWHLYKARRKSYNGGFMASFDSNFNANHLIREEFSATTVVVELVVEEEEEEPPTLVCDEDNGSSNNNNKSQQPPPMKWRLVSVMDGEETQNDTTTTSSTTKFNETKGEGNLRQRRGPKQTATKTTISSKMQEEKEFINPLTLFGGGLVPPELKLAQKQAKLALQQYIQAANA